ncbi:MAG: universal stress protein [Bacteroidota bacterium]
MSNQILVPTDFSPPATYAADLAMKLAVPMSGTVHFFHRMFIHPAWQTLRPEQQAQYPESREIFEKGQQNFRDLLARYPGTPVPYHTTYTTGDLYRAVYDYIDNHDIQLIVMGSSGADGWKEWMFGSNAQKIVRHAHCPVLIVKHPVKEARFKHILFASDFSDEAMAPFEKLIAFGRHFGSHIHLLHVAAYPEFNITPGDVKRMKKFEEKCWALPCTIHGMGDLSIELGITHFTKEKNIDLVAVAAQGKGPLKRMLTGSITESLVNHLEIPVLAINTKELKEEEVPSPHLPLVPLQL